MKKYTIPFTVSLMTLALVGLLGIQIYWVANAIKLKDQEFQDDVNNALHHVSEQYALAYEQNLYESLLNQENQFTWEGVTEGENFIVLEESIQSGEGPEEKHRVEIRMDPMTGEILHQQEINVSIDAKESGKQEPQEIKKEIREEVKEIGKEVKEITTKVHTINEHTSDMLISLEELTHQAEKFSTFMFRLKMHEGELDHQLLDSLLAMEMADRGFPQAYRHRIVNSSALNPFPDPGSVFPRASNTIFHTRLQMHNRFGPGPVLYLHFPGQQSHLLKNMAWALSLSALLMVVITGCFAFAIIAFRKQKKLSDLKTDFINNMSHELKTPISTISLASEALSDPDLITEQERVNYFAGIIFEENQRLKQQVERVLQMGRLDKGELKLKKTDFDFHDVLRKEVERITPVLETRGGSLEMELEAGKTHLYADQVHISGIIQNLLDNAMKYSIDTPEIKVSTAIQQNRLILKVADKGIGMSKEVQKRVFDKFYRAQTGNRHDVKGFGLGLSYVSLMTKAHDGEISLKSEPGMGSEFTLSFPLTHKNS